MCSLVSGTNRKTISDNCDCLDGYYDTGATICSPCMSICGTCEEADICLTCKYTGANRLGPNAACVCEDGYKEDGSNNCIKIVS